MDDSVRAFDAIAREIAEICHAGGSDAAYRVGACIIEKIYDGDFERWRKDGVRDVSYRHLASRPDIPISASALCRAVGVYALRERLRLESSKFLTASHLQEVLPLAPEQQERLLGQAEREHWSIRRLRAEIAAKREPNGRRAATRWLRAIRRVRAILATLSELPRIKDDVDALVIADQLDDIVARFGETRGEIGGRQVNGQKPAGPLPTRPDALHRRDSYIGYIGVGPAAAVAREEDVPSSRGA